MTEDWSCIDGNEAVVRVAHRLSEVIAIYPITPASPMGELADLWSAQGEKNLWGTVPEVIEMQSEGGAAGALHGALQKGALATTFTASQGLLLMLPNMYKIAGELTPAVIHVAARSVATHALSIFGDHSDVMAARGTGFAMLASSSVQEAQDFALLAHAGALQSRVPFLHFFDGFRTSHEVNKIRLLGDEDVRALLDEDSILAHRFRRLRPEAPVLRGSAQNPDVFFQAREAVNPFYAAVPEIVANAMADFAKSCGRSYRLVDYVGAPDAERVLVLMGSGCGAAEEAIGALLASGERVGLLKIRLYRPFPVQAFVDALPLSTLQVAVLDRTKEAGAPGEPLYQDVVCALAQTGRNLSVVGGRYGLSSKEFTPAMVKGVFDMLATAPRHSFTVGIFDDVTRTSIPWDETFSTDDEQIRSVFYGLGSDGTVSAAKSTTKIVGEHTDLHAQGYFVYDSKKSGAVTVSHLRFSSSPIRSSYLVRKASFVACHQFSFLHRIDVLRFAAKGATFLLNSPYSAEKVWDELPLEVQQEILEKELQLWVVDGHRVAREAGLAGRINTVMQPCFFALSGVLPVDQAVAAVKDHVRMTYAGRGEVVVERNLEAIDCALSDLAQVSLPTQITAQTQRWPVVPVQAPDFVQRVTARMLAGEGDLLPVSAFSPDGTFPTGTARWEKRMLAHELPQWEPSLCIDCGKCAIVCPHAAIRMKICSPAVLGDAPAGFAHKPFRSREVADHQLMIQVAPDDCTGCGVCVDVCPAHSKAEVKRKALNMVPAAPLRTVERENFAFFLALPELPPDFIDAASVKGSQLREPLFEFSGACAGCGETPYLKLLTQLFGDRLIVANATGCSSIYGGNLPTTPWSQNAAGRGPAWANSLFEDNAEFGLGMELARGRLHDEARRLLQDLALAVGEDLTQAVLGFGFGDGRQDGRAHEQALVAQRDRLHELQQRLATLGGEKAGVARRLLSVIGELDPTSIWIVGGDGWAYDIGAGGLDHVLGSGKNVNVLVLDTEVYSNTGGQASKATPRGAVAKFAMSGKSTPKKDLGIALSAYGDVYIAQVAVGANDTQTVKAFLEADAWNGPSLIIAYSTCIAHGIDMETSMSHQKDAVRSGYWPLYRYHPGLGEHEYPFHLDSHDAKISFRDFAAAEGRFSMLARRDPERAERLFTAAQRDIDERLHFYRQLADVERRMPDAEGELQ